MKKELIVFSIIFFTLSLLMHFSEFLSHPIEHIQNLSNAGAYGIGAFHPLIFTLAIYLILWIPRGIYKIIKKTKPSH